jgi:nucleotide-binding universal stress UspA family protein
MKFLLATDGSEGAAHARDLLLALPIRERDRVIVLGVPVYGGMPLAGDASGVSFDAIAWERDYVEDMAARTRDSFTRRGIEATSFVRDGPVADAILTAAGDTRADVIVIGSRGLGQIAGAVLGSVARAVSRHSPVPVLVVRDRRIAPTRILAAVDGSDDSKAALEVLAQLPLPDDLRLTLLHVVPDRGRGAPIPEHPATAAELRAATERADRDAATRVLAHAASRVPMSHLINAYVEEGRAVERILARARQEGSDLIVLGSRGMTLSRGFLQGSVADRVLAEAPCAVLIARAKAPAVAREREPQHAGVAE